MLTCLHLSNKRPTFLLLEWKKDGWVWFHNHIVSLSWLACCIHANFSGLMCDMIDGEQCPQSPVEGGACVRQNRSIHQPSCFYATCFALLIESQKKKSSSTLLTLPSQSLSFLFLSGTSNVNHYPYYWEWKTEKKWENLFLHKHLINHHPVKNESHSCALFSICMSAYPWKW